jgi:hypothetical protein
MLSILAKREKTQTRKNKLLLNSFSIKNENKIFEENKLNYAPKFKNTHRGFETNLLINVA